MPSPESSLLPLEREPSSAARSADDARAQRGQDGSEYQVVARRYRPQTFDELVGQEHVARALSNAIATGRVGHAYLFTGARGVGKTSAARILAKALDCVHGPTPTPCNRCDICESIASGNDVDVLEIDGASNRGIDEIRQLRQNVGIRPSRAHFKIYIIDEVHMLTREAFNALLKTLEEPPEHVKFIFCTTEANKIPITILSRCQRFDFAGIRAPSIRERLRQIAEAEGVEAEPAALDLLARRANGSMRDSQSLLEQLLAFGGRTIRAADVHALLGTAGDARLVQLLQHLVERNAAAALQDLDGALIEGVDVGQLLEQLLSLCRDAMAAAVGCPVESFLYTSPEQQTSVAEAGVSLGLETILAILQIIDQALARMRYSTQGRTLAETALVRICRLEDLESLASLLSQLQNGGEPGGTAPRAAERPRVAASSARQESAPARSQSDSARSDSASSKKKADLIDKVDNGSAANGHAEADASKHLEKVPAETGSQDSATIAPLENRLPRETQVSERGVPFEEPSSTAEKCRCPLTAENASDLWQRALETLPGGMLMDSASMAQRIASFAPNRLVVSFPERYNFQKSMCERPDQFAQLQEAMCEVTGGPVQIELALFAGGVQPAGSKGADTRQPAKSAVSGRQCLAEKSNDPLVKHVAEIFGATAYRADPPAE